MAHYRVWISITTLLLWLTGCQAIVPSNGPISWAWSYQAGDYIRSRPAVAGDVVYIGADDNRMHAVAVASGEALWTYETADNVTSSAVTGDGRVYFGSWDGNVYALDTSGESQWMYQTGDWVTATPLLGDDVLYVGSQDGFFYALDADTGELVWRFATNGRIEKSAAVSENLVLFTSSDGYLHAIDASSGQRSWFYYMGSATHASPVVHDRQIYVATLDRKVHALNKANGQLRWTYPASAPLAARPVADADVVYVAADDGTVTALASNSGKALWQRELGEIIRSTPAVWDRLLFVGTGDGDLYALDTRSGAQIWHYRLGGSIVQGPTIVDNKLYIGSTTTQLQAFDLDKTQMAQLSPIETSAKPESEDSEAGAAAAFDADSSATTPSIAEYHRLWRANEAIPDIDAIRALLEVIHFRPQSPAAYLAHVSLARYYAAQEAPAAVDHYRSALALDEPVALRLELAHYLETQGDESAAYDLYRSMLREKPDAFEGMRRTGTDPLQIAADLNSALYYTDALETLRDVDDPAALPLRAEAYLGLGRYVEAAEAYRTTIASEPDDEAARMGLALAQAWMGDGEAALDLYSTVDSAESRRRQAQILAVEEAGEAIDLYLEVDDPDAWWAVTSLLEHEDRSTEALSIYEMLAQSDSQYADDAAYRLVVLGQRLKNPDAVANGRDLLERQGLNWLALRAADKPLTLETLPPLAVDQSLMDKVNALDDLGRSDLAELELLFAARFRQKPEAVLAMASALSDRGNVRDAQRIAERTIAANGSAPLAFWELSYPRPYESAVMDAATEFDVDPLLIWAVMREESRFDPDALSHAGARGLMQVIPSTQTWIAESLGETQAPGDAYVPETSIRIAAWLLDFLTDYFSGDIELAIPAYNAGAGSVEAWQADPQVAGRDDLLRWIGYGETRLYLKRVGLSYEVYKVLYGPE